MNIELKTFLKKYGIDNPSLTYLVAFSGGYDSMFLLDNLKKTVPNKIVAIHLNHNWRKNECDIEEENCKNFCNSIGVEFYAEKLSSDIAHTETAARNARYLFFENCAKKFNSKIVFTAHNKNDNAETLLYRVFKGTGINGLCAINEHRGIFYRPILNIERKYIENYCKKNNLTPNIDSSNFNSKYKRNFIRNEIMPLILKEFNSSISAINSLSEIAIEEEEIVQNCVNEALKNIKNNDGFSTPEFLKLNIALQKRIVYNIFIENNLDYDREKILRIWNFIAENSSSKSEKKLSLNSSLFIYVNNKSFGIVEKNNFIENKTQCGISIEENKKYIFEDWEFTITNYTKEIKEFPQDSDFCAFVNLENFNNGLTLRHRQSGDIITPLGMSGTQKLKKYFISKHIPNHKKEELILLTNEKEVLWIPGIGLSDKIKVVKNPTHLIQIKKR